MDITLRDYLAASALNGIQSQLTWGADEFPLLASAAYKIADAMLKARDVKSYQ